MIKMNSRKEVPPKNWAMIAHR